jgi:hypothetical protein
MPDQPDNYEPSDAELEMVVDEARQAVGKGPAARPSLKGIADMQARIKLLSEQKGKLLEQLELHPTDVQLGNDLSALNQEFREAQERLAEYQSQFDRRN